MIDQPNNDSSMEKYFATEDAEKLASTCLSKTTSFYNALSVNNYLDNLVKMWRYYHGRFTSSGSGESHGISFLGEEGELVGLPVNHFRNIGQHMLNMITSSRPIMEARAVNTDYKSLSQTYLANGILDYYMKEKKLEEVIRRATEMAIVLGTGFIRMEWNATAGELYDFDPETGEKNFEGELEFTNLSPFDVVFDGTKETWDHEWLIVRSFQNKFNLMAKYPELANKISRMQTKNHSSSYRLAIFSNDNTDDIPVYEFFHDRTEALPDGRYMLFLDDDLPLMDIPLPYRQIPVFRISAGEYMGTPYGYSPMFDLFPLQEAANSLYSTIMTNQSAFGVQNLFVQRGSDLDINSMEGALNILEGNSKPEPLNLTSTPPEIFKFVEMLVQAMETISGVSSVTRGNPEASLKSGTALALVQSMSLQFISGLQNNYVKLIEDIGTGLINILKDYAKTPKTIALVGKNNRSLLKQFTGDEIGAINRVMVSVGNPLSRCLKIDTPVLMYDGSIKKVQDIKIDDQLMGPDSQPRTVEMTNSGEEEMYDIYENNIKEKFLFGCNSSHILTLKYCSKDGRYGLEKGEVIDVEVKDFVTWPKRKKRLFLAFRTGVEFESKELPIPAYILGTWLGDGTSATTAITSMDEEIVDSWSNYAVDIGMNFRESTSTSSGRAKTYHITSGQQNGYSDRNSMMNNLRELELIDNKHIPNIYKINSRENRLQLLAGLIDTDGTMVCDGTYVITQCKKRKHIIDDLEYIAKSLGMKTSIAIRNTQSGPNRNGSKEQEIIGTHYSLTIGGDTWEIPCKLPRKKSIKRKKLRDRLNYSIKLVSQGIGIYYGFTLKEEPHFLIGDFTVTHNTTAGRVQMAEQMLQMGLIKNPKEYFQVINTGSLESMYEGDMNELLLIKKENEYLMTGREVIADLLDTHAAHIMEHRNVMADPDLRMNPELRTVVQQHIQEHIDYLRNVDPDLLMLTGQQPLQSQGVPQMPPPMMGQPPQGGMPPMGGGDQMGQMPMPVGPPQGNIPNEILNHNDLSSLLKQPLGMPPNPQDMIKGQGNPGGAELPGLPQPPAPFQQNPVTTDQMMPQ